MARTVNVSDFGGCLDGNLVYGALSRVKDFLSSGFLNDANPALTHLAKVGYRWILLCTDPMFSVHTSH